MNQIVTGVFGSRKKKISCLLFCSVPVAPVVRTLKECCKLRQEERTFQHPKGRLFTISIKEILVLPQ